MLRFIVNSRSGKGAGERIMRLLSNYLCKTDIPYSFHKTIAAGHAKELARELSEEGGIIVAIGGDGTFHEVLNGLNTSKCALGFIPCGRGNDFARSLKISKDPLSALKLILKGEEKKIDYIKVGENKCLNVCGMGLDVAVLEGVEGKRDTKFTYLMSLIKCLNHFKPYELDIEIEGEIKHFSCIMAGVCNGKQFGGNIKLSPQSRVDDGKLEVIVMEMPKDVKMMSALYNFVKGKHLDKPYAHMFVCDKVKVTGGNDCQTELDGEIYDASSLECEIVKNGLRTFLPD